jgi:hypothetical protein
MDDGHGRDGDDSVDQRLAELLPPVQNRVDVVLESILWISDSAETFGQIFTLKFLDKFPTKNKNTWIDISITYAQKNHGFKVI